MEKNKKIVTFLISVLLVLIFINQINAAGCEVALTRDNPGQPVNLGYQGATGSVSNAKVLNNNIMCEVTCTYQTSQGRSGSVPGNSGSFINAQTYSPYFSIPFIAQGGSGSVVTVTVNCHEYASAFCSSSDTCSATGQVTINYNYCGDGTKNGPEICDGGSTLCSNVDSKYYSTSSANCKSDCSGYDTSNCPYCGDGGVNGGEQCDNGGTNGQTCTPSYGSSCNYCTNSCTLATIRGPFCGDGKKDSPQENCKNCYQDSPCPDGQTACGGNGECIDLNTNENCGSIGNRCDTSQKVSSTGQRVCSSDNTRAIQIQTVSSYKCINKICQSQQIQQNSEENCGNNFCQDGHCGCNEGYSSCQVSGKCEKSAELKNNDYCKCDFQCKSGICENSMCIEGLISNFNSDKTAIRPGDETTVSFTANNPFDYPITVSFIVKLGSGVGTSAIISGQDCRESQCTTSLTIPAKSNGDISLILNGKSISNIPLTATMTYNLKGKPITVTRDITVKVTECGKEDCSKATFFSYLLNTKIWVGNSELSLLLLTIIVAIIILLIVGIVFIMHTYFKHRHPKKEIKVVKKTKPKKKKK